MTKNSVRSALLGSAVFLNLAALGWTQTLVGTEAQFNAAVAAGRAGGSKHIVFTNDITHTGTVLEAISGGGSWIIDGAGYSYDGGNVNQGFTVYDSDVTFQNLTVQNTRAVGGTGGAGHARQFNSADAWVLGAGGGGLGGAGGSSDGGQVTQEERVVLVEQLRVADMSTAWAVALCPVLAAVSSASY